MPTTSHTGNDADEPIARDPALPVPTSDDGETTTTHAMPGAGRPRLVFAVGPFWDGSTPREFDLLEGTTVIGSAPDADLQLEGLEPVAATITHTEDDEYVLDRTAVSNEGNAPVDPAQPATDVTLRTGAPVAIGEWAMVYARDEFADHGRPFGGREGGEGSHQPQQPGRPTDTPTD